MSRKIDALIAEHVFGLDKCKNCQAEKYGCNVNCMYHFRYSTNISDAWLVLQSIESDGCWLISSGEPEELYCCEVYNGTTIRSYQDTAPMAICLASLKAKNVEIPGE